MKQETSNRGFFQKPEYTDCINHNRHRLCHFCCLLGSLAGMFLLDEVTIPGPTDITVAAATVQNVTSTPIKQTTPTPTIPATTTNIPRADQHSRPGRSRGLRMSIGTPLCSIHFI